MQRTCLAGIVLVCMICQPPAGAATRYVWQDSLNPGAGFQTWDTAAHSINDAVGAAAAGDTVWVTNGVYTLTGEIAVASSITLKSVNGREQTSINGGYPAISNRCLKITAAAALVDGFTISNGYWTQGGGIGAGPGVYLGNQSRLQNCLVTRNTHPTESGGGIYIAHNGIVSNCEVSFNSAYDLGGGISMPYSNGVIVDCLIHGNVQTQLNTNYRGGGGVYLGKDGRIVNCVISNNVSSSLGGGLYFVADAVASNCTIVWNSNNVAGNLFKGGGVAFAHSNALLVNSTVAYNRAGSGAGIYLFNGRVWQSSIVSNQTTGQGIAGQGGGVYITGDGEVAGCEVVGNTTANSGKGCGLYLNTAGRIRNCLIAGNWGSDDGGGIYANSIGNKQGWIASCTVASNYPGAGGIAGGVYLLGTNSALTNCVIYGNPRGDFYTSAAANTNLVWHCCLTNNVAPGQGNISGNPLFADAPAADYRLRADSPCIDRGLHEDWMDAGSDLDGRRRLDRFRRAVDMGAYEFTPAGMLYLVH